MLLRTPFAIEEMRRHSRGVTDFRLRLYWDEFKQINVPVPTSHEQDQILNSIQEIMTKGDTLITEATQAITLLRERRAALISAAVTGKIDVRAFALSQPEAA
jgi:type I restriction enzyme S subunit